MVLDFDLTNLLIKPNSIAAIQEYESLPHIGQNSLKSTTVSVCFRGIIQLPSAFIFLR